MPQFVRKRPRASMVSIRIVKVMGFRSKQIAYSRSNIPGSPKKGQSSNRLLDLFMDHFRGLIVHIGHYKKGAVIHVLADPKFLRLRVSFLVESLLNSAIIQLSQKA